MFKKYFWVDNGEIKMKKLIILLIITGISYSQMNYSEFSDQNILSVKLVKFNEMINYIYKDLNRDGKGETITGSKIIKIKENEFWVQNAKLNSVYGEEIIFNIRLLFNKERVISQVNSIYGYIIIFENGSNTLEIYLADVNGNKNSDAVFINF